MNWVWLSSAFHTLDQAVVIAGLLEQQAQITHVGLSSAPAA